MRRVQSRYAQPRCTRAMTTSADNTSPSTPSPAPIPCVKRRLAGAETDGEDLTSRRLELRRDSPAADGCISSAVDDDVFRVTGQRSTAAVRSRRAASHRPYSRPEPNAAARVDDRSRAVGRPPDAHDPALRTSVSRDRDTSPIAARLPRASRPASGAGEARFFLTGSEPPQQVRSSRIDGSVRLRAGRHLTRSRPSTRAVEDGFGHQCVEQLRRHDERTAGRSVSARPALRRRAAAGIRRELARTTGFAFVSAALVHTQSGALKTVAGHTRPRQRATCGRTKCTVDYRGDVRAYHVTGDGPT